MEKNMVTLSKIVEGLEMVDDIIDCYYNPERDEIFLSNIGALGHNCTITTLDGKSYLIDCTYRQFFTERDKKKNPRHIYDC